jgi:hypothetical protein
MTEEKMIEEILYESHSVGMRNEVIKLAYTIIGSKNFKYKIVDAYQQSYNELVESKL